MVTAISITLFLVASYFALVNQKYRNFKRFLKPGDLIRFDWREDKHIGRVKLIGRKYVHIICMGTLRKVPFSDTYPVFRFRYKKEFD